MVGKLLSLCLVMACPAVGRADIAAGGTTSGAAEVGRLWGIDQSGAVHRLEGKTVALVFLGTECPISRQAIGTLNKLAAEAAAMERVEVLGVISDPTVTRSAAMAFADEYKATFPILFDGSGALAAAFKPAKMPEAFVLNAVGEVKYHGRVDDAYVALGKPRGGEGAAGARSQDLRDALTAVAAGKSPAAAETPVVGCVFEAWGKATAGAPAHVTYYRDIAPVIAANCVSCHKEGQVAPFTLTGYEDASKRAKQLAEVTADKYMPPWRAAAQKHRFTDERRLSESEIALFAAWAKEGAPAGDKADAAPVLAGVVESKWRLGEPDLVLEMPVPFEVPAGGKDIYRAFVVPVNIPEDTFVTAVEFQAGAPTVVHHAILYLDGMGSAKAKEAASTDGKPGYVSFGGPGFLPTGGLGGWAPGASPAFLPDGVGRPLHKGSDLVMQVHYHPDGKAHQDQSRVGVYFAKKPIQKVAVGIPLMNRQIDIAPGDPHYVKTISLTLPRGVEVLGITPHMHLVGRSMKVMVTLPDGTTEQLIDVPDWDFRWQDQYRFATPVKLPAGTKVNVEAVYDNSEGNPANPNSPPKRVRRGEQTTDEMCIAFVQILVDRGTYSSGQPSQRLGALRRLLQGEEAK